jgi:Sec-independent protein secretion pathway component TatC
MMFPLIILYEMSILLARLVERGRERRLANEAAAESMEPIQPVGGTQ